MFVRRCVLNVIRLKHLQRTVLWPDLLRLQTAFVAHGRKFSSHEFKQKQPVVMKLETPEFKSIFTPELTLLSEIFQKYGHELRVAGGAVRDILMGKQPQDLDFATTATPDEMKEMFTAEGIRMINTKGEKHGTITARINDKENFEVTTLRIDIETDGRHAEVQFTTDWQLDANRRDLTINSMFLGLDGTIYDYFDGREDLKKRKVTFVGDAETRIKEDYLRILRYFRFFGRIAKNPDDHEPDTLEAIKKHIGGLERISGERIWSELKKILEGNFAGEIVETMLSLGIAPYVGLPSNPNIPEFKLVWVRKGTLKLHPITLLVALLKDETEMMNLHSRLKLSAYERDLGQFVVAHREDKLSVSPLKPYQLLAINSKSKMTDTREWIEEVFKYRGDTLLLKAFQAWPTPRFPISGNMLKEKKVPPGRALGMVLQKLKEIWVEKDYDISADALLLRVPEILSDLNISPKK